MKTIARYSLVSVFIFAGLALAAAQEATDTVPPPKVLAVFREFLKPGKGGSLHEKAESGFVQAFARAKWPQHYFTVNSVTGKPHPVECDPGLPGDIYLSAELPAKVQAALVNGK